MSLFGKDMTFYTLLEGQAAAALAAAQAFQGLCDNPGNAAQHAGQLQIIKNDSYKMTRELVHKVDSTFVTPLDKNDLHALSTAINTLTDRIEGIAARIALYHLTQTRPELRSLAELLAQTTQASSETISNLRDLHSRDTAYTAVTRVHDLANNCDGAFREALASLLNANTPDPSLLLKWKDVYDHIERAVNDCENLAEVFENVVVKYA